MNFEECKTYIHLITENIFVQETRDVATVVNVLSEKIEFLANEVEQMKLKLEEMV